MRKWLFIGFGLTIVGCWLMVDGIRNRFDLLDSSRADTTEVLLVEQDNLVLKMIPFAISGNTVESITLMSGKPISNNSTKSSQQKSTKLTKNTNSKFNSDTSESKSVSLSDFEAQLSGNEYHNSLISTLIEEGWESDQLKMLVKYLADPRTEFLPEVLKINATHVEKWEHYSHHLTEDGFEMCDEYWGKNHKAIRSSAKMYDFPPEIILGILKVETNFGKYGGTRSVFNVFWSLSLGDDSQVKKDNLPDLKKMKDAEIKKLNRRARWARKQLADLLYMAKSGGENPVGIMGSWAGAFGLCQFIPRSYRYYGRDGDGDNIIDLDNISDASASIANYLKENGWRGEMTREKQKKSIMRYNHSEFYADCVLALADGIVRQWKGLEAIE